MPKVSEEEWNEENMVWLSPRQMLAIALLINEVQRYPADMLPINSEFLKELHGIKAKMWEEVQPMLYPNEVKRANIDP